MTVSRDGRGLEYERMMRACESATDDEVSAVRALERRWDEYRSVMRAGAARVEESGWAARAGSPMVQRDLAAVEGVRAHIERLADEQGEMFWDVARTLRAQGEVELDRLRRDGASWV